LVLLVTPLVDYTKLRRDLATIVARVCPGWPAAQRDDLVQAAVMRVMQVFGAGAPDVDTEGMSAPRASYLYKVAHSVLVDELRRIRRQRETSMDGDTLESIPAVRADPERLAASRQIGEGIKDCLSRLKRERRLAVTLYLQGHTVPQSARILDWSPKRTENLVYRGLAELRDCLTSKGLRL
jgi:RNA polymerase sigma-70 factor (ECF subfamily)